MSQLIITIEVPDHLHNSIEGVGSSLSEIGAGSFWRGFDNAIKRQRERRRTFRERAQQFIPAEQMGDNKLQSSQAPTR